VVQEAQEWKALRDDQGRELPRRAGVSSFGFGGVNAHVVLEEYVAAPGSQGASTPQAGHEAVAVVLSAKNEERLQEAVAQLLEHVESSPEVDLRALAYTLQVGRDAMEARLGFVAETAKELKERLHEALIAVDPSVRLYRGKAKPGSSLIAFEGDLDAEPSPQTTQALRVEPGLQPDALSQLVAHWVEGGTVVWAALYGHARPRRLHLPTYSFAKERQWVGSSPETPMAVPPPQSEAPASRSTADRPSVMRNLQERLKHSRS
jgi:polyketide synthase PksN